VTAGSPAEKAGLLPGDVLVALDGRTVADVKGLSAVLRSLAPGATVDITILRGGEQRRVTATLEAR
jgi:S1-C subfamily serine protease